MIGRIYSGAVAMGMHDALNDADPHTRGEAEAVVTLDTVRRLCVSVEHYAARADAAEATAHRIAMERDGARASLDASRAARMQLSRELAAAHARIADLERLAAGPRTLAVDDGLARPFAPETLPPREHEHGWDADGREVK